MQPFVNRTKEHGDWLTNGLSAGPPQLFVPFPGHALHDKGLQRQKGVGPLVNSQGRRALFVPVINRLSTAGQPLILFLRRFT